MPVQAIPIESTLTGLSPVVGYLMGAAAPAIEVVASSAGPMGAIAGTAAATGYIADKYNKQMKAMPLSGIYSPDGQIAYNYTPYFMADKAPAAGNSTTAAGNDAPAVKESAPTTPASPQPENGKPKRSRNTNNPKKPNMLQKAAKFIKNNLNSSTWKYLKSNQNFNAGKLAGNVAKDYGKALVLGGAIDAGSYALSGHVTDPNYKMTWPITNALTYPFRFRGEKVEPTEHVATTKEVVPIENNTNPEDSLVTVTYETW